MAYIPVIEICTNAKFIKEHHFMNGVALWLLVPHSIFVHALSNIQFKNVRNCEYGYWVRCDPDIVMKEI